MRKVNGHLLIFSGFFHMLLGVLSGFGQLKFIVSYGIWNALGQQSQSQCLASLGCAQANALWWFVSWGAMLVILGAVVFWVERCLHQRVPTAVACLLFFLCLLSAILMPVSGFWFVMLVAMNMILCNCRKPDE